jgi:hypothetical protein
LDTSHADSQRGETAIPQEVETALRASAPEGESIVWYGSPVVERAVEQHSRSGWQRVAILGGGYSVVGSGVALWITGDIRWLVLPVVALAVCCVGLWSEHRRSARIASVLSHTAYALTVRHAVVVQTQPIVQRRTIALAGAQLVRVPGAAPGVEDVILQAKDGQHLVFSDIADAAAVEELVDGLKAAPDAFEQQVNMLAQWAEIAKQVS